ncbi:hypothetical protein EYF80_020270 [Liparis tanakae]|uniref:Uncharacterized protein n=1 Tax=Liparis tanakae TaxID=230148 RepID=A0A4Z2HUB1_9TELE|nr:hypothetical protein EYF80_020270 [Liparis tanakae]
MQYVEPPVGGTVLQTFRDLLYAASQSASIFQTFSRYISQLIERKKENKSECLSSRLHRKTTVPRKLPKTSCFLLQSIAGALLLLRVARAFCLASAAVRLRRRPASTNGSETRLSSSSWTCDDFGDAFVIGELVSVMFMTGGSEAGSPVVEAVAVLPLHQVAQAGEGLRCLLWGEFSLGTGEAEGVGPGEGRGDSVPISTARSSVHARPRLRRYSSVSASTTSSLPALVSRGARLHFADELSASVPLAVQVRVSPPVTGARLKRRQQPMPTRPPGAGSVLIEREEVGFGDGGDRALGFFGGKTLWAEGQLCWFRHTEQRGRTGRQTC